MANLNRHPRKNRPKARQSLQSSILSRLSKSKKRQLNPSQNSLFDSVTIPTQPDPVAPDHDTSNTSPQADLVADRVLSLESSPGGPNEEEIRNLKRKRTCDSEELSTLDTIRTSQPTSTKHTSPDDDSSEEEEGYFQEGTDENSKVEAGTEQSGSGGGDQLVLKEEVRKHDDKSIDRLLEIHSKKFKQDPSKLISEFHRIEKQLSQPNLDPLTRHKLKLEKKRLGGLEVYQTASKLGGSLERGGETGKWCAKTLIELGLRPSSSDAKPNRMIRLLDVGAIDGKSYSKFKDWISTTSIDLNPIDDSSDHQVLKVDFFEFPIPRIEDDKFDVVSLSLVLNFIGDLKKRGEMIKRSRNFLKQNGKLFIVLPLACLNNSRYLDFERFENILSYLGFTLIKQHDSAKLTYWFLEKQDPKSLTMNHHPNHPEDPPKNRCQEDDDDTNLVDQEDHHHQFKNLRNHKGPSSSLKFPKVQIRSGPKRNNFCIKV